MALNSDVSLARDLTEDEKLVLTAFHEALRDSARVSVCYDLRPWVFMHDGKFVFVLRCPDGPVCEMTLVNSCHEAISIFGKDIFSGHRDYTDVVSVACYNVLLNEPCYIVRSFRPKANLFVGTNVKREEEPVKKTGFKRIICDTTDAGLYMELDKSVDLAYDKLMKDKKTEFKGIDGKTIINCEDLARVRPFKVMVEIPSKKGPTVVGIKYCVRLCDNNVSTEQLYRELDKAIEVTEATYNEIIKLKRTWCTQQVVDGKISPFAVAPGMVNKP